MGYSKGRERLYNIIDATRCNKNMGYSKGRERLYNIIDATRIWDIVKGGKDYIT